MNALRHQIVNGLVLLLLGCGQTAEVVDRPGIEAIDAYPLLVDAIRHSGCSEAVVQSGRFEMTRTRSYPRPAPEEYEKEYQRQLKMLNERQTEVDDATRTQIEATISNAPQKVAERVQAEKRIVERMRFVFEGVAPSQRTCVTYLDTDQDGSVRNACVRLSSMRNRGQLLEEKQFVNHDLKDQPADISIEEGSWFLESPNEFGRLRGRTCRLLTLMLRDCLTQDSGRLDEQTVQLGRELNRRRLKESNGEHGVQIVGREEIEGSTCVIVETDDPGDTNLRSWVPQIRVWIDPERGFITPRIVELANNEPGMEYVSSDYQYLEEAGLWWPRVHEVTNRYEQWVARYEIDLDRSCVNCPIDEAEFELSVEPGDRVSDRRGSCSLHFVIQKPYRMKFGRDGRLNFDAATGVAANDPSYGYPPLEMLFGQPGLLSLVLANVAFGCFVLLVYRLRIRNA